MRTRTWLPIAACTLLAAAGIFGPNLGQAQNDEAWAQSPPRRVKVVERQFSDNPFGNLYGQKVTIEARVDSMHRLHEVAAKVRDADSDEARDAARKELESLLDEHFERDMKRRAEELSKIEERVKKLHAQMEKRAAKKQEIIDLQMKVLENEADGLGFFNSAGPLGKDVNPWMIMPNVPRIEGGGAAIFMPGEIQAVVPSPAPPPVEVPAAGHPTPASPANPGRPPRPPLLRNPQDGPPAPAADEEPFAE